MGMFERSSSSFTVVLKYEDVFKTLVFLQINHAIAKCPDHIFHALDGHVSESLVVLGSFYDDLVSADAVHLVEHALGLAIKVALDAECRELVGNHAHAPTGRI